MIMHRIVTLTMNPTIDKSTTVYNVVPEWKLRCQAPRFEPGGGGINVSRAIMKLGGTSLVLYAAGGPQGEVLEHLLELEDLDHHRIKTEGWTRENLTVYEETSGQQFRFDMPGPEMKKEEWECCLRELEETEPMPAYVVASGSLPPGAPQDFYGRVAVIVRRNKARLIVDTSGDALNLAVEEGVYLIKPNLRELGHLAGKKIECEAHQKEVAGKIVEKNKSEAVVISLGAAGALLVTREGSCRFRAPMVPIESKVGAGDSMVGGIVLALARGESLLEAVRMGIAAGSAAVMTPGTELCRREDAERLYKAMKRNEEGTREEGFQ
jgi:6-phosphofructokinase 2